MNPVRRALCQRRPFVAGVDPLLVQGMTGFVEGAEDAVEQHIFSGVGGDAHIAQRKFDHEGVVRLVLAATVKVVAKLFDHRFAKFSLRRRRKMTVQTTVVDDRAFNNFADQWHQRLAQLSKERPHRLRRHPVIRSFNEYVDGFGIASEETSAFAAEIQRPFQQGLDGGKIVGRSCPCPHIERFGHVTFHARDKIRRHFCVTRIAASGQADERSGVIGVVACR